MVFFLCVGLAAKKETIDTSPEQIKKPRRLRKQPSRQEKRETIIQNLEEKGIKDSNFAKVVDDQVKTALVPDEYKAARSGSRPSPAPA